MTNLVKFTLKQIPAALNEIYVRVTDLDRNELYSGVKAVSDPNLELDLGSVGSVGQGVLIHGDGYIKNSNESTFKSFCGYSEILQGLGETPNDLREIDTIVVFGASILEQTFEYSENRQDFKDKMAALGMNITVYERAQGGNDSYAMRSALPNIISEFLDKASTTLFLIHWGGNDLANYPADAAGIEANLRAMLEDIKAAGFLIAMSNTTYRITPPYGWSSDDFNANIQEALVQEYADIPLDLRKLTFDNQDTWFGDPSSNEYDGVHPAVAGRELNRVYLADTIAPAIKNISFSDADSLKDALIQFGSRDVMSGGYNNALNNTEVPLYNTDYSEIPGGVIKVTQSAGVNNEGRGNVADPNNDSLTVMNNTGLLDSFYTDSSFPILIDLSKANINADDVYTLQISASRNSSDPSRVTTYSIGGQSVDLNATLSPPQFVELEVSGLDLIKHPLECSRGAGSSFGYISLLRVINKRLTG